MTTSPAAGKCAHVALDIHLGLLALGRRRQRHHPEDARADPLGDRLDGAALARAVASLEDDADLESLVPDPLLQLDQLDMQLRQFLFVVLLVFSFAGVLGIFGLAFLAFFGFGCTHGLILRGWCRRRRRSGVRLSIRM